ncbi:MAG: hypothetical protein OEW40_11005 [Cyclobacteriaceae bacterium]|nr:hypothetical protein [Cyclobacteriaceae bacterium]
MKVTLTLTMLILQFISVMGQTSNPKYDSDLVRKLGADDYGMKMYVFVILKTGNNKTTDEEFIKRCFTGHLENIGRMVEAKQLVVAGPFGKNDNDFRGLFILDVGSVDDAKKILETDPAISAGLLLPELYPWYGSAALPEYLEVSDKIWKIKP